MDRRSKEAREDIAHEVVNHYVPKEEITKSIVFGTEVTALCGVRYVVEGQGSGSARNSTAVVCPLCGNIYDGLAPISRNS
ncbi:DUF3039 domain-containing protein [Paenarthrobacter ilicis]|uniref:DUF3039 domain-containing protein n=1 Tax=Paenarthrobacter ilicis TaxID=43665 RepID=UPI003AB6B423